MTSLSRTALKRHGTSSSKEFQPHQYQLDAIAHLLQEPAAGLFLSPGLGKTAITLQAIRVLLVSGAVKKVLVLAPLRVCYNVWPQEIRKWANFNGITHAILHGPKKEQALDQDVDIYLCNPEGMKWLMNTNIWDRADMLVVDESSMWRTAGSKRFKMLKRKLRSFVRRVILTGTPTPNGLLQLWSQVFILDGGQRLEKFVTRFQRRYFDSVMTPTHANLSLKRGAVREIQDKISDIIIYRSNDELDLPPITHNVIDVQMPPRAQREYEELRREFALEDITALNAGVLANKLRQIASGASYDDDGNVRVFHDAKLEAYQELVCEQQGSPLLVFYQYRHDVSRLQEVVEAPVLGGGTTPTRSAEIIKQWNNDELPVLYLHPASAGHGLNLQGGSCRTACWFSIPWDYEHYEQAIARIHRQGQSNHVVLHHIVARGTIDRRIMTALRRKSNIQQTLLEYLRGTQNL